jgi:hypothetical protein
MTNAPKSTRNVYFIKLGRKGSWVEDCLFKGTLRLGYHAVEIFDGDWNATKNSMTWVSDGGARTRHVSQVRAFYEANEQDIFITFHAGRLYWCRPTGPIKRREDGGHTRRTLDGWSDRSLGGILLSEDRLSGDLTKVQMFQGTISKVHQRDYLLRKLRDEDLPQVEQAIEAEKAMLAANLALMRLLTWQDFELLIDLIFSASGWRRTGQVGRTQKMVDLELELPTTGERAFVQVKSRTSTTQFRDYLEQFAQADHFDRMFYVWHSGSVDGDVPDDNITLVGPDRLAQMVLDAGLSRWLRDKVS